MPHDLDLILTLTGGLTAALALGLVTNMLRLSPIVGYLLAGVLVGPFTPGFVAHAGIAEQLAELGVILLMFGVGLHFHLNELLAVRSVAVPGALVQIAVASALGLLVAHLLDWGLAAGLVFGLAVSVAVHALHREGVEAVYGDATQPEILTQAGIIDARSLIFTATGSDPADVIRIAMQLNPNLLVLARASFLSEAELLRQAGAHVVVAAEAEVALAMAERLLRGLGATAEQLDRERDRVRAALAPPVVTEAGV